MRREHVCRLGRDLVTGAWSRSSGEKQTAARPSNETPRRTVARRARRRVVGSAFTVPHALGAVVLGLALTCTAAFVARSESTSTCNGSLPVEVRSVAFGFDLSCYYLGVAAGGALPAYTWRVGGWRACVAPAIAVQLVTLVLAMGCWAPPESARAACRPLREDSRVAVPASETQRGAGAEEGRLWKLRSAGRAPAECPCSSPATARR